MQGGSLPLHLNVTHTHGLREGGSLLDEDWVGEGVLLLALLSREHLVHRNSFVLDF